MDHFEHFFVCYLVGKGIELAGLVVLELARGMLASPASPRRRGDGLRLVLPRWRR